MLILATLIDMYHQLKETMDVLMNQNAVIMERIDSIEEANKKRQKQAKKVINVPNNIKVCFIFTFQRAFLTMIL